MAYETSLLFNLLQQKQQQELANQARNDAYDAQSNSIVDRELMRQKAAQGATQDWARNTTMLNKEMGIDTPDEGWTNAMKEAAGLGALAVQSTQFKAQQAAMAQQAAEARKNAAAQALAGTNIHGKGYYDLERQRMADDTDLEIAKLHNDTERAKQPTPRTGKWIDPSKIDKALRLGESTAKYAAELGKGIGNRSISNAYRHMATLLQQAGALLQQDDAPSQQDGERLYNKALQLGEMLYQQFSPSVALGLSMDDSEQ